MKQGLFNVMCETYAFLIPILWWIQPYQKENFPPGIFSFFSAEGEHIFFLTPSLSPPAAAAVAEGGVFFSNELGMSLSNAERGLWREWVDWSYGDVSALIRFLAGGGDSWRNDGHDETLLFFVLLFLIFTFVLVDVLLWDSFRGMEFFLLGWIPFSEMTHMIPVRTLIIHRLFSTQMWKQ